MQIPQGTEIRVTGPQGSFYLNELGVTMDDSDFTGWVKIYLHRQPKRDIIIHVDNLERVT